MWRNSTDNYGLAARLLHWTIALAMAALFALGWYITTLDYYDPGYKWTADLHRSCGVLVFVLALARIAWALADRKPALAATLKPWERVGARAGHGLLYLMTLAIPFSGYLLSTADGHAVGVFGLFEIPALLPSSKALQEATKLIHYLLAFGTAWLVLVHALAALKHQFVDRDGTLGRMLGRLPHAE